MFDVPVEQAAEISLQIEGDEAEIVQFLACSVVWYILHQRLDGIYFHISAIVQKHRRNEAAESQTGENA